MMVPLDVTFRNMERDEQIVRAIDAQITELETLCDVIIGCHVVVDVALSHQHSDSLYGISVVLALPCCELKVRRGTYTDTDVYLIIGKAFESVRQQLHSWLQEKSGKATPATKCQGGIVRERR